MWQLLLPVANTLIDRLIPDTAEAAKAKLEMEKDLIKAANEVNLEQIKTNQIEAANPNIWASGWRPGIGWTCAAGFFWAFVGQPLALWALALSGSTIELPQLDTSPLLEMTFAMLGLAGLRTYEKGKGLAK